MYPERRRTGNKAIIDKDNWIRCVWCGHKLGRIIRHSKEKNCLVEIKCHSCKTINICSIDGKES